MPVSRLYAERIVELPCKEGEQGNPFLRRDKRLSSADKGTWTTEAGNECEGEMKEVQCNEEFPPFMMVGGHKALIVLQGGLVFVFASFAVQKGCRKGRAAPALWLERKHTGSVARCWGHCCFFLKAATSSLGRSHCVARFRSA